MFFCLFLHSNSLFSVSRSLTLWLVSRNSFQTVCIAIGNCLAELCTSDRYACDHDQPSSKCCFVLSFFIVKIHFFPLIKMNESEWEQCGKVFKIVREIKKFSYDLYIRNSQSHSLSVIIQFVCGVKTMPIGLNHWLVAQRRRRPTEPTFYDYDPAKTTRLGTIITRSRVTWLYVVYVW